MKVTLCGGADTLTERLERALIERPSVSACERLAQASTLSADTDVLVYLAAARSADPIIPNLADAERVFRQCADAGAGSRHVVLVASTLVWAPHHHHHGMVNEDVPFRFPHPVADRWRRLEALAREQLGTTCKLTILRVCPVVALGVPDPFSRLLERRLTATLPGYDPPLQFLHPDDLAEALGRAVEHGDGGVFHVAPSGVVPLRQALRLAGCGRVPLPRWVQHLLRGVLAPLGLEWTLEALDHTRYPWTVSGERARQVFSFQPRYSSAEALRELGALVCNDGHASRTPRRPDGKARGGRTDYDDFGMDPHYIEFFRRTLFRFLYDFYWRIETRGLQHLPREGRAVLVGVHRGFMPLDGTMALHMVAGATSRYPRFLLHPTLLKFPFLFNFMSKLGGIPTCPANADRVLQDEGLLGVFPEGIQGAFTLYRNAYRLGRFGRNEFVRMALRNRASLIPFVTVGSAEIFPILAKIRWRWVTRVVEWPFLPLTPTFPLLPLPLPSKWHTLVLPPLAIQERYPPEAADDPEVVRAIGREVRETMQAALQDLVARRRHIFFGSVFPKESA